MTEPGFQLARRQAHAYESLSGLFMGPSAQLIVGAMDLQPGDAFLDLACGTGLVARRARDAVGRNGRVVGVDVNAAMLAEAASISPEPGIEWMKSSASELPLADGTFTHAACQQGLQFFPDATAAMREVHRVLRGGGLFSATIWATPGHNPYIDVQLALLSEVDADVARSAQSATPLQADELLATLAADAGFTHFDVAILEHVVEVADVAAFFLEQTATTPWAPVLASLSPQERSALGVTFAASPRS